ncbi:hypothetical protein [Streptomyces virginiae]
MDAPDETAALCAACRRRRWSSRRIRRWLAPVSAACYYAARAAKDFLGL